MNLMKDCDPKDIALKALFLGPQAENASWLEKEWIKVLRHWVSWRRSCFPEDGEAITPLDQGSGLFLERQENIDQHLQQLLHALEGELPKFTPRFLGHMLSELSLPAILGHIAVLLHNPNQTSREVSRISVGIEKEAVGDLIEMVGMQRDKGRGHFTSGGTLANFESLWRVMNRLDRTWALGLALLSEKNIDRSNFEKVPCWGWEWFEREKNTVLEANLAPFSVLSLGWVEFSKVYEAITGFPFRAPLLLAPASRHYSWSKAAVNFGWGKESLRDVALDENGRLSMESLQKAFANADSEGRSVAMVVTVAGATGTGAVDPIADVQDFLDHRNKEGQEVWHHVDAAYGGYFRTLETGLPPNIERSFRAFSKVHSITLDPHKLGFVPYSCGTFLARDAFHYRAPSFDAPYLVANNDGAVWMHTIEGSRAATGVAATWMANRSIGLNAAGYGLLLEKAMLATREMKQQLTEASKEILVLPSDLNIICFSLVRSGETLSESNRRTMACFEHFLKSPNFSVSKTELSSSMYARLLEHHLAPQKISLDDTKLVCIRLVLMNPFLSTRETKTNFIQSFVDEVLKCSMI